MNIWTTSYLLYRRTHYSHINYYIHGNKEKEGIEAAALNDYYYIYGNKGVAIAAH